MFDEMLPMGQNILPKLHQTNTLDDDINLSGEDKICKDKKLMRFLMMISWNF